MLFESQQIDRYHILHLIGSGGMGSVYLAEDPRIGQQVAIKVIRTEASSDADRDKETIRLFQREVRAIAQLDHPHILPLFDYGEEHLKNMTLIYLVMPYRQEGSLIDRLHQGSHKSFSPQEVAHIVQQAAGALQHAHAHSIVHQDVKPSNFLIRNRAETPTRPDILLADFGIARLITATSGVSQSIRGTPTYMAPEQWEGRAVPASDQYGLAVMAYELLTGRPPFHGGFGQMMYQHLMAQPTLPSTLNPHLSKEIDTVLLAALAKDPGMRFASITAFAQALNGAIQALPDANAPILTASLNTSTDNDYHAVLAISTAEALAGTTRIVTLPGGRQVRVTVPAKTHNGQEIRLEEQGEATSDGSSKGALILAIEVKPDRGTPTRPYVSEVELSSPTIDNSNLQTFVSSSNIRPLQSSVNEILPTTASDTPNGALPVHKPPDIPSLPTTLHPHRRRNLT
ncbi:MAG: protein kinase, partial [Chloroflexota bacterium]|nr:protein kinase [Chloroflexota bacterium]